MVKFFVTGDNHIGKKYDRYKRVKDKLIDSRFESLSDMVKKADADNCAFFVITGDLFDNVNTIKTGDVKRVVDILAAFTGDVIIIPGNHDYYTGNEKVWADFEAQMGKVSNNITILNEFVAKEFETGDDKVVFYPAFCQSKHSKDNNLGWIKESDIDYNKYNIGIAHGAISGLSPDMKEEFFLMTESELNSIPVDAWFIGHTHISYPELKVDEDTVGYKVFNPGTHQQLDLHNRTEGCCFEITVDKFEGKTNVAARKVVSGKVTYHDLAISVSPDSEVSLHNGIEEATSELGENAIIRLSISGVVKEVEYKDRNKTYDKLLGNYMDYEIVDAELSQEITLEQVKTEYSEISFAYKLMEELVGSNVELQMAYQLMDRCKE